MNKKTTAVNGNLIYMVALLSYGVIVANMYYQIPILQALEGFAKGLTVILAIRITFLFLLLVLANMGIGTTKNACDKITSAIGAKLLLEKNIQQKEAAQKVTDQKFNGYTIMYWALLILAIIGGGTYTAVILFLLTINQRIMHSLSNSLLGSIKRLEEMVEAEEC